MECLQGGKESHSRKDQIHDCHNGDNCLASVNKLGFGAIQWIHDQLDHHDDQRKELRRGPQGQKPADLRKGFHLQTGQIISQLQQTLKHHGRCF